MGSKASKALEEAQKSHTKEISLKEYGLKTLPLVVCTNFNYITKLNLNDNVIKEIPPDIYKLRSLKIFWVNNNKITTVPDEVGLLAELEDFQIDGNQVHRLNKVFFELKKVTDISMSRNHLKEIPTDFSSFTTLKSLALENNELTALPGTMSSMVNLKTLNVGQNNIEYIFNDFSNMPALTSLTLFGNRLAVLPENFGRLGTLVNLNLRSNHLESVPDSFNMLKKLTTLSLWDNSFQDFPLPICYLESLTELSFSNNTLRFIPPEIKHLTQLRKLYLQYNQIEYIPTEIRYLVNLNILLLHHNRLASIPCEISLLKRLESINLFGNPLPAKLVQSDQQTFMACMAAELEIRKDVCSRVIQQHYRVWKKQFRFRSVVRTLVEMNKLQRNIVLANHTNQMIQSTIKIQRWYRSRKLRIQWHELVSKVLLLIQTTNNSLNRNNSTNSLGYHNNLPHSTSTGSLNNINISVARLGSLFGFDEPDSEANVTFLDNHVIKAATVTKLVEYLCNINYSEEGFMRYFFSTYPSFITPLELFQLFCVRYHVEPPQNCSPLELAQFKKTNKPRIQERVINLFEYWIKYHLNDFQDNPKLLQNFNSFITNTLLFEKETSAKRLIAIFNETKKKHIDTMAELMKLAENAPKPILPLKSIDPHAINVLDLSSIEIARQMALIDQVLLSKISASELLSKKWSKCTEENQKICPNILNMIGIFNQCSKWISSEIVGEKSSKTRVKKLKFFIKIAQHCYDMCNFNGLMLIISGLSCSSVTRLKGTWGALSSRRRERFDTLERFVNMEGNFKQYRMLLSEIPQGTPCIPFVGLYLMDLTFIDEGNPAFIGEGNLINFVKKRLEANLILRFMAFKNTHYCFESVPFIQDLLLNSTPLSEKELYDRSVAIEKRHIRKITKKENRERKLATSVGDLTTLVNPYKDKGIPKSASGRTLHQSIDDNPNYEVRKLKRGEEATTSSPAIMSSPERSSSRPSSPILTLSNDGLRKSQTNVPPPSTKPHIPLLNFAISTSRPSSPRPSSPHPISPKLQQQQLSRPSSPKPPPPQQQGEISPRTEFLNESFSTNQTNTTYSSSSPPVSPVSSLRRHQVPFGSNGNIASHTMKSNSSFSSEFSSPFSTPLTTPRSNPSIPSTPDQNSPRKQQQNMYLFDSIPIYPSF